MSTSPKYTLLYHPGIPGRGEYIRLCFEATGTPYLDPANAEKDTPASKEVYTLIDSSSTGDSANNPPPFAPPLLRIEQPNSPPLLISQTPNILLYLSQSFNLAGSSPQDYWHVNSLTLTALDLSNEAHDTHHPVAVGKYYSEQKDEALKKARDFRENRIPKFLGFFERVLRGNEERGGGGGRFLVGGRMSVADLTLWQVLDGLSFAFPKEMEARAKEFPLINESFRPAVREIVGIKEYLSSERRLPHSDGIFRHYPELDRQ